MLELLLNFFLLLFSPNAGALGSFSAATYILHQKSTMPGIEINHSETLHIDPKSVREIPQVNDCNDAVESYAQQSHEECMLTEKTTGEQLLDKGCLQYGYWFLVALFSFDDTESFIFCLSCYDVLHQNDVLILTVVLIIDEGAVSELLVAMKFLTVVTAIMRRRWVYMFLSFMYSLLSCFKLIRQ